MRTEDQGRPLPTFSVIIPVHDGGEVFARCMAALAALRPAPREIIVVADACADDSEGIAARFGARILRMARQGGPARARNRGAEASGGEYLFFVDSDVLLPANTMGLLHEIFSHPPVPDAVIGSYDDTPMEKNFLSQYKNLLHHYVHQQARENASTFWGACGAVRRDVFLEAGGFDERYFRPSVEDVELGYRLRERGHVIRLVKTLRVKHMKKWTCSSLLRSDLVDRAIPWTELLRKRSRFINDLNLDHTSRLGVILAALTLLAAALTPAWPYFGWVAAGAYGSLVVLNLPVYRFFTLKLGLGFALLCLPWHFLYFCSCGLGFLIGAMRILAHPRR